MPSQTGTPAGFTASSANSPDGIPVKERTQAAQRLFQRGVQLLQSGQPSAALPILLEATQLDATLFDAHLALGSALMNVGRFADAGAILLRALRLRPDSAAAWRDMGIACDRQNLHEQAIEAFRRALELSPKLEDVLVRLSELYTMYSRMEDASDCLDRAAGSNPDSTKARLYRADALVLRGDMSGAEQWARKAVALEPSSSPAHGTLAGILYAQGRFDEAAKSYEAALRLSPTSAQCWYGLAFSRKYSETDQSILDRMRAVLQRPDLHDADRMTMYFALGKVYDDCGDYGRAMEAFDAANRLRARDLKFDRASLVAMVDRNIQRFTKDFLASKTRAGSLDPKPLFIVGMYRSGTTLVEQILSSHPQIAAGDELTVWTPADLEPDPATGDFEPVRVRDAVAKYLSVLQKIGPSAMHVTDKLPFNLFRLGAIHCLLPKAKIIHCRRDPVDTCLSVYSNLFRSRVSFAARKDDLVFFYRQYERMMDHWRKVLPSVSLLEVGYESLIADREAQIRRLIAFTGLEWNERCLKPDENRRPVRTASAWQVRQPVYAGSAHRWKNYEPWLGELRQLRVPQAPI